MQDDALNVFIFPDIELDNKFMYPIGQVAARFGLTLRAVRFYCEVGLIRGSFRNGSRYFDVNNVKRLSLVLKAKFLGFSLSEIATMIVEDQANSHGVVLVIPTARIEEEINGLEKKQDMLLSQLQALSRFKASGTPSIAA